MNYEELLANINSRNYKESRTLDTPYAALRAVVELHKPYEHSQYGLLCKFCDETPTYPCNTIQVIEQELA